MAKKPATNEAPEASNNLTETLSEDELKALKDPDEALRRLDSDDDDDWDTVDDPDELADDDDTEDASTEDDGTESDTSDEDQAAQAAVENNQQKIQQTVPHAALHAERQRRKALEQELAQLRAQQQAMAQPQQQQEEQAPPPYVDPIVDPEGYRAWAEHAAAVPAMQVQQMQEQQAQVYQQQQQQAALAQVQQRANAYDQQMTEQEPNYPAAAQWMREQRAQQLFEAGYTQDDVTVQLQHDVLSLIQAGEAAGINPARLLYQSALENGFQPPSADAHQQETNAAKTDLAEQKKTVAAQKKRMAALDKAKKNTQSPTATGEAQSGKLTVKAAASMSEAELAKLSSDDLERILSGG